MTFRENSNTTRATRLGFTLVELLVVITIIGILAGLALVALSGVPGAVQDTAVKMELTQIATALDLYKQNRGSYPPDLNTAVDSLSATPTTAEKNARNRRVTRHLDILFPQRNSTSDLFDPSTPAGMTYIETLADNTNLVKKGANATGRYELWRLDPSETYVLFLMGFSTDIENPLTGGGERTPLFEFDETRLIDPDDDGWWSYKSDYNDSEIVYFNSKTYANSSNNHVATYSGSLAAGIARPYGTVSSNNNFQWVNANTFQLLSAGRDGDFGTYDTALQFKLYPSGLANSSLSNSVAYTLEDLDNITNFTEGSTLEADEDLE